MKTAALTLTLSALLSAGALSAQPGRSDDTGVVEHGRYLAQVSGCNDCHTPGYMQTEGQVPAEQWLTGSAVGFRGPWGTSYPANLRLYMDSISEAQWLVRARQPMRAPMPWFNLRAMSDGDLVALYRYVRSLGPAGEPAPIALEPGRTPTTPYIDFVPKNLPQAALHASR